MEFIFGVVFFFKVFVKVWRFVDVCFGCKFIFYWFVSLFVIFRFVDVSVVVVSNVRMRCLNIVMVCIGVKV